MAEALKANKPVVALESTIISHGMPYPRNIEVAERLEQIIRENGAMELQCCYSLTHSLTHMSTPHMSLTHMSTTHMSLTHMSTHMSLTHMSTTHMSLTHLLHVFTSGAIPATIAIINGFPKIGLTSSELKLLAQPSSDARSPVIKASRRDVAYACAHRLNAGL